MRNQILDTVTLLITKFLMATALLTFHSLALAGGTRDGGGGVGVSCVTDNRISITMLDAYEAENIYGFGIPDNFGSVAKNILEWTARESRAQGAEPDPDFWQVERIITSLFKPVKYLPIIGDFSKWKELSSNCEYVQIAKFIDPPRDVDFEDIWKYSTIEIVMDLYNKLDDVGKASLILHEYNYFRSRWLSNFQRLSNGSDDTRIVSAALMTNKQDLVVLPVFKLSGFTCQFGSFLSPTDESKNMTPPTHLYAVNDVNKGIHGVRLYFQWYYGFLIPIRSSAFIPNLSTNLLKHGRISSPIILTIKADLDIPGVKTQMYNLRLESSKDLGSPLLITPTDLSFGSPAKGFCG